MEEHEHVWAYAPAHGLNPVRYERVCTECHRWERRYSAVDKLTSDRMFVTVPATDWVEAPRA